MKSYEKMVLQYYELAAKKSMQDRRQSSSISISIEHKNFSNWTILSNFETPKKWRENVTKSIDKDWKVFQTERIICFRQIPFNRIRKSFLPSHEFSNFIFPLRAICFSTCFPRPRFLFCSEHWLAKYCNFLLNTISESYLYLATFLNIFRNKSRFTQTNLHKKEHFSIYFPNKISIDSHKEIGKLERTNERNTTTEDFPYFVTVDNLSRPFFKWVSWRIWIKLEIWVAYWI